MIENECVVDELSNNNRADNVEFIESFHVSGNDRFTFCAAKHQLVHRISLLRCLFPDQWPKNRFTWNAFERRAAHQRKREISMSVTRCSEFNRSVIPNWRG